MSVRKMSAVRKIHSQDGVAWTNHRRVRGLIRLRAGMGLNIGILGAKELLCAIAGEVLDDVGVFAASVITLAGIAFGVLIREDAAGGFENCLRGEVFAGDQFESRMLALGFVADCLVNFGVGLSERQGHCVLFSLSHDSFSNFEIFPIRRAWRPPSKGVSKKTRTISWAA